MSCQQFIMTVYNWYYQEEYFYRRDNTNVLGQSCYGDISSLGICNKLNANIVATPLFADRKNHSINISGRIVGISLIYCFIVSSPDHTLQGGKGSGTVQAIFWACWVSISRNLDYQSLSYDGPITITTERPGVYHYAMLADTVAINFLCLDLKVDGVERFS